MHTRRSSRIGRKSGSRCGSARSSCWRSGPRNTLAKSGQAGEAYARCNWLEALLGVEEGGRVRERMRALRVSAIMAPDPLCVDEDATIDDVVTKMDMREISQLPVVRADQVIGMSAPAASWCDPAGESPAQVRSSVCLVARLRSNW